MNQDLLTRLFKSIQGDQNAPLMRIAFKIIDEEREKGHHKLAGKLEYILKETLSNSSPTLKPVKDKNFKLPVDRRYRLPLARHIEHDDLRHHMVLHPQVEAKIMRIEKEYLARERLAHHGLLPRKKVLFYGSSGCGKSMAAERIAWDLGIPFYKIRFDSIMSSYLGESAANLQQLFESIREYPCVLLLDEFDIIGKKRDSENTDVGEVHRIVNILLGLLEDYNGQGILVATTNLRGSLDKALFRRFDDIIEMPKPNTDQIVQLLQIAFSAHKISKSVDLKELAIKMDGLSYAIVEKIARDAAKKAVIYGHNKIQIEDLFDSLEENAALDQ